jgi:Flp pilus assembly protein TadG
MPRHESMLRTYRALTPARLAAKGWPRVKEEDGGSLVEYALVVILLLLMVFGIGGFALGLYAYHFVGYAARDATRWASVNGSTCATDNSCISPAKASDVQNYVTKMVPAGIDASQVTVAATWPSTGGLCAATKNAPGCTVKVQVTYKYNFVFPLIHSGPLTLSSSSEMTITH